MLNSNCVICAELFTYSDDVRATSCGHVFHYNCLTRWIERSKSCPQCRHPCTRKHIIRIFFNVANLDSSSIDIGSLQEKLDNADLKLKLNVAELRKAEEEIKNLKQIQKKSMKTITGLEDKVMQKDFIIQTYKDELRVSQDNAKNAAELRKKVKSLEQQLSTLEGVSSILTATNADVDKLLQNETDVRKLAVWVTTLRRELRVCENKKTDLRNVLKVVQTDIRREIEAKKSHEERISQLESENYQLNEKLKALEEKEGDITCINNSSGVIDLNKGYYQFLKDERRSTISPRTKENVKKIEESSSPYLNIKSSSIGLAPLFKCNHDKATNGSSIVLTTAAKMTKLKISPSKNGCKDAETTNNSSQTLKKKDSSEKLSIFSNKRPRIGVAAATASATTANLMKPLGPNMVYNGFGGSEKADPFANYSDSEDDFNNNEKKNKFAVLKKSSTVPSVNKMNLKSRLKSGNLRDFKIAKK